MYLVLNLKCVSGIWNWKEFCIILLNVCLIFLCFCEPIVAPWRSLYRRTVGSTSAWALVALECSTSLQGQRQNGVSMLRAHFPLTSICAGSMTRKYCQSITSGTMHFFCLRSSRNTCLKLSMETMVNFYSSFLILTTFQLFFKLFKSDGFGQNCEHVCKMLWGKILYMYNHPTFR